MVYFMDSFMVYLMDNWMSIIEGLIDLTLVASNSGLFDKLVKW